MISEKKNIFDIFLDVGYQTLRSDQRIRGLLRKLWQDEDSKDLKIVCRSRKIVKCHRAIFRIISPFLRQVRQNLQCVRYSHINDVTALAKDFLTTVYKYTR